MSQQAFKYSLGVNNSVDVVRAVDATSLGAGVSAWLIIDDALSEDVITDLLQGIITDIRDGQRVREATTAA